MKKRLALLPFCFAISVSGDKRQRKMMTFPAILTRHRRIFLCCVFFAYHKNRNIHLLFWNLSKIRQIRSENEISVKKSIDGTGVSLVN